MYKLRDYQKEAVEKGLETFYSKKIRKDIIVLPSGSGKSLVIASIAKQLKGSTIVFQPSKEILLQNLQKMYDFGFTDVGIYSASMGERNIGKITFATIGTIYNKKEIWDNFDNIIIDEAHRVNAKGGMYKEFIKANNNSIIGLTATPYRLHSYRDIHTNERVVVAKFLTRTSPKIFSNIVHVTQVKKLYEDKFLCSAEYVINDKYKHNEIKLNSTGMDFNENALKTYNKEKGIIDMIIESITKDNSKHILVFNIFVEEAEELSFKLRQQGITAETISAETNNKDRDKFLKDFKSGKIKVITNVGVLTTGFDFPALDCIILARPTQSVALYYQMIGRGIRINDTKLHVKIIDICGNVNRFGRVETFEIVHSKTSKLLRLKSEVGYLTGYDFVNNQDIEKTNYKGLKESQGWNNDIIPFGKYKGTHIKKIPTEYLAWCVENFKKGNYKIMFEKELKSRDYNL